MFSVFSTCFRLNATGERSSAFVSRFASRLVGGSTCFGLFDAFPVGCSYVMASISAFHWSITTSGGVAAS